MKGFFFFFNILQITVSRPFSSMHRPVGLVVKASASRAGDPGFDSRLRRGERRRESSFGIGLNGIYISSVSSDRLVGLVVKASASRAEDPGFESRLRRDFFRVESSSSWYAGGSSHNEPVTWKLALQWLPCQARSIIGSALGPVGPVSVYCDWVR